MGSVVPAAVPSMNAINRAPTVAANDHLAGSAGQAVIESDGTTEDPLAWAEYRELDEDERACQHAACAEALLAAGQPGTQLGSLLYHLERAGNPAASTQFVAVAEECFERGFYAAALDLTLRARVLFGGERPKAYWNMTNKFGACMCYLGRAEDSLAYFAELCRGSIDPEVHMNTAYMLAMLYTRHLPTDLRDQDLALEWVNTAIAMADRQPDAHRKAFFGAFMRNARALVELRLGDLDTVMSLLREAIELTDTDLATDEHLLHRSVLVYNRAQVYAAMGNHDAALIDYDEILRRDPNYGDYYFERAGERRAAGRFEDALADYASAIQFSPPFHEAHSIGPIC